MKACYFGAYIENSLRNQLLKKSLKDAGIDVIECNVPADIKLWRQYARLIKKYILMDKKFDVFIVPEFSHKSMIPAYLFKKLSFLFFLTRTFYQGSGQCSVLFFFRIWISFPLAITLSNCRFTSIIT